MTRDQYTRRVALLFSLIVLFAASTAHADTAQPPVVSTLTISPSYVASGASTTLSWVGAWTASGVDLYFNCPVGVSVSVNGGSFPCNTSKSYSGNLSDSGAFTFTNLTGSQQYVDITAYPKDANGVDYPAGSQKTTLLVGASGKLLTSFSFSASTTLSGAPVTIAWSSTDPLGVNLEFSCSAGVQITVATGTVPCNTQAFSPDLASSGSTTVTFANNSIQQANIQASVVPVTSSGVYDMTRALSGTLTIQPSSWQPTPTVTSFSSSPANIISGVPFSLSWSTSHAAGANIEFFCANNAVVVSTVVGTSTTPVQCNTPIFPSALGASGSTTLEVVTQSPIGSITAELLPQQQDGTYLGLAAQTLTLQLVPPGSTAVSSSVTSSLSTPAAQTASSSGTHYTFTKFLQRGSSNADVTALQKFLARDPSLYPSGLVTGYFGAATLQAVELFQQKNNIAKPGDAGYGLVGPKTRAALNAAQ
ncbi:MAG: peptidoglycan-binding domain-containing protein [Candidatus Pacebacteria bacterium]|nr:peptidoglycan-binding domain-containing protein [Candidatus Paceibacterota bacterium]